jgi:RNA polymerase sigma-70 factor (ECF subfamily)
MDLDSLIGFIELSKSGDNSSFDKLFQVYRKSLYLTALAILENNYDAEDAVQDTAIIAFSSIKNLTQNQYIKTWITRILINRCKRILSIKKRNSTVHLNDDILCIEPLSIDEITLWDTISLLNKKDKLIITLRFFNDLDVKEISNVLKCPYGTAKSKLHRAIKKLKLMYDKE